MLLFWVANSDGFKSGHSWLLDIYLVNLRVASPFTCSQLCRRPSEIQRPLVGMMPASVTSHTKPLSGTVCEDILNLTEVFGLLTLLPGFEDHEKDLLLSSGGSFPPDTLQDIVGNLKVVKHIWLRICSAAIFSLRSWAQEDLRCTKEYEDLIPGELDRTNEKIRRSRDEYKSDCFVFLKLFETHFPRSSLSTNAHSAICRAVHEMDMMGALLIELWIEKTLS